MPVSLSDESVAITLCAEGAVLADAGDLTGAVHCYQKAVNMAPSMLELHLILSNAQKLAGNVLAARSTLRRAIRVAARPDATTEFTLGKALVDVGAGADAVTCFRRVRAELPNDAAGAAALAAALREAQQPDEAWTHVTAAIRMAPTDPVALLTAALIRHDLSDLTGALDWCEKSLTLRPDNPGAMVTRGYLRHLLGDVAGGWSDFESRPLPAPDTGAHLWRGESLDGKSLLVLAEQGVGDQFQFLRFVHHSSVQEADRVIVTCQPDAVPLLRASGYNAVARDTTVFTDYYVPLLSLPQLLGVGAEWRGAGSRYLTVPEVHARDRSRVKTVGIVWAGNPAHRNDAVRSIPPAMLHSLVRTHPQIRFISMQHDVQSDALPQGIEASPHADDWLDTAHRLCTLDLLITVDTGIAHLAGALGLPAWLLIPHVPDWRWGAAGNTTPWYPSIRLFRQPARDDWARVLTNVSAALSGVELGAR
jgi:tetratricopeptide (TPR) repeat protein